MGSMKTRVLFAGGAFTALLVVLAVVAGRRAAENEVEPAASPSVARPPSTGDLDAVHEGFLYARIAAQDGTVYEGRLRWGGDEEAFWGDYFNGFKDENTWAMQVPPERLKERRPVKVFGVEIARREKEIDLGRPFMARFGDIARIEGAAGELRVELKSGTEFHLDRFDADDFADGVRVWDTSRGVVDLGEREILTIELRAGGRAATESDRLQGTVHTRQGEFTGFVQWNRKACVGSDTLVGQAAEGELSLRFDTIRSIARKSRNSALVTLLDGREVVLSGTRAAGQGNRGLYVDDRRYGRVLVSWDAFERVDFGPGEGGPGYDDFPSGHALAGLVTAASGRRLAGRLVFDLDESETTETLDAPSRGVAYTIPFGLIASITPPRREEGGSQRVRVTLHDGEVLELERKGDLGEGNAGLLIFVDDRDAPTYVPWSEVARVELDRPSAMYPPFPESNLTNDPET